MSREVASAEGAHSSGHNAPGCSPLTVECRLGWELLASTFHIRETLF